MSQSWPDSTHGWVFGGANCSTFPCPDQLLQTTNGGASWQSVRVPQSTKTQQYQTVRFAPDLRTGFIIGNPASAVTTDGGVTWTTVTALAGVAKGDVQDLLPTATGTWVAITPPTAGPATLGFAPPGSTTFTPVAVPGGQTGLTDLQQVDGVLFAVGQTDPPATASNTAPVETLVRVQGMAASVTPLPPEKDCNAIAASSATALITVCGQGSAGGGMGSRSLYGTTDAGKTFVALPNPGAGGGYDTGGVLDLGNSRALIVTAGGLGSTLLATSDGRTWHPVLSVTSTKGGGSLDDLTFPDTTHGFVILNKATGPHTGTSAVYSSSDGGLTWKAGHF